MITAFLVDDEPLAVQRLARLLTESGRVNVIGSSNDPLDAIAWLSAHTVDTLFLDINMPGMNGFEMLRMLDPQPTVVFTTAYDHFALEAFRASSIDYLVKPVDQEQLDRALTKLERLGIHQPEHPAGIFRRLESILTRYPERIASRIGDRIIFLDLPRVTHFYAGDKLTFASVKGKPHMVEHTIAELEARLDPAKFFRIHRSTLVNLTWVHEIDSLLLRLRDESQTELVIARDRARALRDRLGI